MKRERMNRLNVSVDLQPVRAVGQIPELDRARVPGRSRNGVVRTERDRLRQAGRSGQLAHRLTVHHVEHAHAVRARDRQLSVRGHGHSLHRGVVPGQQPRGHERQLPSLQQSVLARGNKLLVIRMKQQSPHGSGVCPEDSLRFAVEHAPRSDVSRRVATGDLVVIGSHSRHKRFHRVPRQRQHDAAVVEFHDPSDLVTTERNRPLTVGADCHRPHIRGRSRKDPQRLVTRHVPDSQRVVRRTGNDDGTIGMADQAQHRPGMPGQRANLLAGHRVPQLDRLISPARDHVLLVRRKDRGIDRRGMTHQRIRHGARLPPNETHAQTADYPSQRRREDDAPADGRTRTAERLGKFHRDSVSRRGHQRKEGGTSKLLPVGHRTWRRRLTPNPRMPRQSRESTAGCA